MRREVASELQYLVATDVAARGIDISDLSHVINYALPDFTGCMFIAFGRTRAGGKKGVAVSLVSGRDEMTYTELERLFGIDLEACLPPHEKKPPCVFRAARVHRGLAEDRTRCRARDMTCSPSSSFSRTARLRSLCVPSEYKAALEARARLALSSRGRDARTREGDSVRGRDAFDASRGDDARARPRTITEVSRRGGRRRGGAIAPPRRWRWPRPGSVPARDGSRGRCRPGDRASSDPRGHRIETQTGDRGPGIAVASVRDGPGPGAPGLGADLGGRTRSNPDSSLRGRGELGRL